MGFIMSPNLALTAWKIFLMTFSDRSSKVLLNNRKPSARGSYLYKWNQFLHFLPISDTLLMAVGMPDVFDLLLSLQDTCLGHSSFCVYLAIISIFHASADRHSVFSAFPERSSMSASPDQASPSSLGLTSGALSFHLKAFRTCSYMESILFMIIFLRAIALARRASAQGFLTWYFSLTQ